jgi:hypothetical protein
VQVVEPKPLSVAEESQGILGREPGALLGAPDLIAVFSAEEHVADFKPNLKA